MKLMYVVYCSVQLLLHGNTGLSREGAMQATWRCCQAQVATQAAHTVYEHGLLVCRLGRIQVGFSMLQLRVSSHGVVLRPLVFR